MAGITSGQTDTLGPCGPHESCGVHARNVREVAELAARGILSGDCSLMAVGEVRSSPAETSCAAVRTKHFTL